MYPLARAVSRSRATGNITEIFALLQEPHCLGHFQQQTHTVADWLGGQGLQPYTFNNDLLLALIRRKNQMKPGPLDPRAHQQVYQALYDLDAFREKAFINDVSKRLTIDPATYALAREDDTALLKVGINWLQETVFKNRG